MKKVLTLTLVLVMLLSMAACGGSSASSATPEPEPTPTEAPTPEPTEAPTPEPTEEPTPEPTPEPEPEIDAPIQGVYDEEANRYVNEYFGFGFQMDEEWTIMSDEQIADSFDNGVNMVNDEELAKKLEESGELPLFAAATKEGLINVNVVVENLGKLYGAVLDEQTYAEVALGTLTPYVDALGFDDVTTGLETATLFGEEHPSIVVHGSMQGFDMYITAVCAKFGQNMVLITATSVLADATTQVLDMFYTL